MADNKESFFEKQTDKLKNAGKHLAENSDEGSVIGIVIGVYKFIVSAFISVGERFGFWIEDKEKEIQEKKERD